MGKKKKRIKEYDEMLKKHIAKKDVVKILRTVTEGEADVNGFILKMSKEFLLIQTSTDFSMDGYAIIKKDHFDGIRCNKFDKTYKKIITAEGITKKQYGIRNDISLKDWQSVFEDLIKYDYHVVIECEDLKKPTFTIGPIVKVNKNSIKIRHYDATGKLDKNPTKINYKDITLVVFGDRYIDTFRKYLKSNDVRI